MNQLLKLAFLDQQVVGLSSLECLLELSSVCISLLEYLTISSLESDGELLNSWVLVRAVIAEPDEGLIVVLHWDEFAKGRLLDFKSH